MKTETAETTIISGTPEEIAVALVEQFGIDMSEVFEQGMPGAFDTVTVTRLASKQSSHLLVFVHELDAVATEIV